MKAAEKKESKKEHYKNIDFAENLVAASGGKTLEEAAPLWRFSHFGAEKSAFKHCQLCHSRMKLWLAIRNTANGVVLFIGHDCYDKLVSYLATKKLESVSLGSRKQYISTIKKYCKQNITESFLAWFGEQAAPEELTETLKFIEKFGYAPTLEAAEALVLFYKTTRRFSLEELLGYSSHRALILRALFSGFPEETTPLEQEVSLAEYEELDLCFADGLNQEEVDDGFLKEALRKTSLPDVPLKRLLSTKVMGIWIENAQKMKPVIVDEAYKRAVIDLEKRITENQDDYLLLTFWEGRNPKHGTPQWESRDGGIKYVLGRESAYSVGEGPVLVRITRDLVPDKVYLVSKLTLTPSTHSPRYSWISR